MKTLVIDCSALCYSSAHTLRGLEADEVETGVIFGFLRQIRSFGFKFITNDIVFCWDSKKSIRKEMYPEYKKKRKKQKEDPEIAKIFASTYVQMNKLKEDILPKIGFTNSFEVEGYEADDLIASVVQGYEDCVVISNDDDLLQLLDYANLYRPAKKQLITAEKFKELYGIAPSQWADVKALAGCKSDEVPGIDGVGEKTAIKFLNDELPENYKAYQKIEDGYVGAMHKWKPLVELPLKGTPQIELNDYDDFSVERFLNVCVEYQFESFMKGIEREKWISFLEGRL